jgi:hypothetical protein
MSTTYTCLLPGSRLGAFHLESISSNIAAVFVYQELLSQLGSIKQQSYSKGATTKEITHRCRRAELILAEARWTSSGVWSPACHGL